MFVDKQVQIYKLRLDMIWWGSTADPYDPNVLDKITFSF